MFENEEVKDALETQHTIELRRQVYAEWNMNDPENIERIGNHRFRPRDPDDILRSTLPTYWPMDEVQEDIFINGATDSDVTIDGGVTDDGDPEIFVEPKRLLGLLYSLEDCFKPFRPRSGINKILLLANQETNSPQFLDGEPTSDRSYEIIENRPYLAKRPRYYASHRDDPFKYWTSYRTEGGTEYGVSDQEPSEGGQYFIDDVAPFVVYKEGVAANRLVVKMQTNVGDVELNDIVDVYTGNVIDDPFYGRENMTIPSFWRVEVLDRNGGWREAYSFTANSTRANGDPIIGEDGYVELSFALQIPEIYRDIFVDAGEVYSVDMLPDAAPSGYAYLVKENQDDIGTYHIYYIDGWETFTPQYNWDVEPYSVTNSTGFVKDLDDTRSYIAGDGARAYREFDFIRGIRIVVDSMNKGNCTFDLIEMSPRLAVDMTKFAISFNLTKTMADLGNTPLPIGGLLSSTGSMELANYQLEFSEQNVFDPDAGTGSIVANALDKAIKFDFYDVLRNIGEYNYWVPLKTMYTDKLPESINGAQNVSIELRDAYGILEAQKAPETFLRNISLSNAVMVLLDSIGFTNFTFRRKPGQPDPIIPYFFVPPDQSVAEILNELAKATQSAMYFDEYNNLVIVLKERLLPAEDEEFYDPTFALQSETLGFKLPNIIEISSADKKVLNDGVINYTKRSLQRNYATLQQAQFNDASKTWVYAPTLLWEVSGSENTKSINEQVQNQSSYALAAMALDSDLSATVPTVDLNGRIIDNVIDVGSGVYFIARYNGYFYAAGEIIRYDAVEYNVSGQEDPVWITSTQEYQKYILELPFNGKMYPTGNIRIYAEPKFNAEGQAIPGECEKHGRGQFGTDVVYHNAGIASEWTSDQNLYGVEHQVDYLFNTQQVIQYPDTLQQGSEGGNTLEAYAVGRSATKEGFIKNTLSQVYWSDEDNDWVTTQGGTVQSSALTYEGNARKDGTKPYSKFISYTMKEFDRKYVHYGTRMRIIGEIAGSSASNQDALGASPYYYIPTSNSEDDIAIQGGSGGMGIMVNNQTNEGYFMELIALNKNAPINLGDKQIVGYNIDKQNANVINDVAYLTTNVDHEFEVGDTIAVAGFNINNMNGNQVITSINGRTISYGVSGVGTASPDSGGIVEAYIPTGVTVHNVVFYKVVGSSDGKAYPIKLWTGLAPIITDTGMFAGEYRVVGDENPTVYDIDIEYKPIAETFGNPQQEGLEFYLYLNGKQLAVVRDTSPLPVKNNMALFVRGNSKCMFENVYAVNMNYGKNGSDYMPVDIPKVFGTTEDSVNEALRKYSVSGMIQGSFLSGISADSDPEYIMYYDEFGTIMREMAYFDVKFDRAYPALTAQLAPTFSNLKTYAVSGFRANAYGAKFMVFNATDKIITLDSSSGNYLRILGVTFTQSTSNKLTVDDYYKEMSDFSKSYVGLDPVTYSARDYQKIQDKLKISRMKNGITQFDINSLYIQDEDTASEMMGWITDRVMKPKRVIGASIFPTPTIQLGDMLSVDYQIDGVDTLTSADKSFVVYNIEYSHSLGENSMTVYLAEV